MEVFPGLVLFVTVFFRKFDQKSQNVSFGRFETLKKIFEDFQKNQIENLTLKLVVL